MFNRLFHRNFSVVAACGAIAATAFAAAPAARAEQGQMRVDVRDLDLNAPAGAQAALRRIERLSDAFCDAGQGRVPLERRAAIAKCQGAMTDKAVAQLNAPLVTALRQGGAAPATQVAAR